MTDHHAVIPTRNLQGADLSGLPVGEKAVLELVSQRLLCAVAEPHTYSQKLLLPWSVPVRSLPPRAKR